MAHADYDCCAVCDSKQSYNGGDSETKEEICSYCLKALRAQGLSILDPGELIQWIETTEDDEVIRVLKAVGYSPCFYLNRVDNAVMEALGHEDATGWDYRDLWLAAKE